MWHNVYLGLCFPTSAPTRRLGSAFLHGVGGPSGWRRWCWGGSRYHTPLSFIRTRGPPSASSASAYSKGFSDRECNVKVRTDFWSLVHAFVPLVLFSWLVLCFCVLSIFYCLNSDKTLMTPLNYCFLTSPIQTVNSIVTNDVRQRCRKTVWVKSSSMEVRHALKKSNTYTHTLTYTHTHKHTPPFLSFCPCWLI